MIDDKSDVRSGSVNGITKKYKGFAPRMRGLKGAQRVEQEACGQVQPLRSKTRLGEPVI